MATEPGRILMVEDVADTRHWLRGLLASVFGRAGIDEAGTLKQARPLLAAHTYDMALIDLELPDGSGVELVRDVNRRWPHTWCVIATTFDDDAHLFDALRAGARGYLLKEQSDAQIVRHLRGILDDQPPLSPRIARRVLSFFGAGNEAAGASVLTARELQVLTLIARGLLLKEVAHELNISVHTAGDHVKSVYRKLRVNNRVEATTRALRLGLVPPP